MSRKFYIVPSTKSYYDVIESDSKEDALIDFATNMTDDMSAYFKATDETPVTYPHEYEFGCCNYEVAMAIVVSSMITKNEKSAYYVEDFNNNGKSVDLRYIDALIKLQEAYDITIGCLRKGNPADHLKITRMQTRFYTLFQAITGFMFDDEREKTTHGRKRQKNKTCKK